MKPRILWCNECSVLKTGYATYGREILNRLCESNKYSLAEHASYIHRDDTRIQNSKWTVYANLPDSNNEKQAAEYNSKPSNQFGEWRFDDICLDFKPHIVMDIRDFWMLSYEYRSSLRPYYNWCFVGDTPVLTPDGGVCNIENLKIGDNILNGQYISTTITNISQRLENNIIELKASGWGVPTKTTGQHQFFVIKNNGRKWNKNKKRYFSNKDFYSHNMTIECPAKNIDKGDMLVFPPIKVNIDEHQNPHSDGYTNRLAVLIGYFISKGSCDEYGHIRFTLHKNETEYANDIIKSLKSIYPNKKIENRVYNNVRIIGYNSKNDVYNFWSKFYDNDKLKIMPSWVFNSPKHFIKEVVRCMWRGDGCVVKNKHCYSGLEYFTNSKSLAISLWQCLIRLNIITNVTLRDYNNHIGYRFFVYGEYAEVLNSIVQKIGPTKFKTVGKISKKRAWFDKDGWLIVKVTSCDKLKEPNVVYDIEVNSNTHDFLIPYRVHNCIMPTVDAFPQNQEWLSTYSDADGVFTYQDWSKQILDYEGGGRINTVGTASPAAAPEFKPMDKDKIKKNFGFEGKIIVGTVMRNQRRKLFPDLFASFRILLNELDRDDVILHCHTSYPDMGWNIPDLLLRYNLTSKVTFTYKCKDCGHSFPDFFHDIIHICKKCGNMSASFVSVQDGIDNNSLSIIYNMFDVYVQYANSEGLGMPQLEAAACGIPVLSVDYSAMSDVVRKLSGTPIPLSALSMELETGCFRAIPNNAAFIKLLKDILSTSETILVKMGRDTREAYLKYYGWDNTAKKWMDYFDSIDINRYENMWQSPPNYIEIPTQIPNGLNNTQFAKWLIVTYLKEDRFLNSYMETRLIRDLNYGVTSPGISGMYFNDDSASPMFHKTNWTKFNREIAVGHFTALAKRKNHWENKRWQSLQE